MLNMYSTFISSRIIAILQQDYKLRFSFHHSFVANNASNNIDTFDFYDVIVKSNAKKKFYDEADLIGQTKMCDWYRCTNIF